MKPSLPSTTAEELLVVGKRATDQLDADDATHAEKAFDPRVLEAMADMLYRLRRLRIKNFPSPPGLFADPAWDLLLDLFVQRSRGRAVSVTSACIASDVPPTTALRWIAQLDEIGMITRVEDTGDRRRAFLQLTPMGLRSMRRYLADAVNRMRSLDPPTSFGRALLDL
jgi:hypothetical protein